MAIPRSVHASLIERFIFNFRMRPEAFAKHLPVPWLQPQIFNGWCVVSFCILQLNKVMVSPLPGALGYETISCAYRCGVIDTSGPNPEPSVYITDRNTDVPLIARLAPWLFSDTIPVVRPEITHAGDQVTFRVNYLDKQKLFFGEAQPASQWKSEVFGSLQDYADFIHLGVSSYTPSIYGESLARVDLHKDDPAYEPLDAKIDFSWLDGAWSESKLEFDSAVRAHGGRYKWTYRGLKSQL
jgi:hypothetical protein